MTQDTRKAPLRKIVGTTVEEWDRKDWIELNDGTAITGFTRELLECGHSQRPVEDFYGGRTYTVRRRCLQCLNESEQHTPSAA